MSTNKLITYKIDNIIPSFILKINEFNSIETHPDLNSVPESDQQFRLAEINKIKDYFNVEIQERKRMSKKTK